MRHLTFFSLIFIFCLFAVTPASAWGQRDVIVNQDVIDSLGLPRYPFGGAVLEEEGDDPTVLMGGAIILREPRLKYPPLAQPQSKFYKTNQPRRTKPIKLRPPKETEWNDSAVTNRAEVPALRLPARIPIKQKTASVHTQSSSMIRKLPPAPDEASEATAR